ncbi:protein phosphatase 2C domain-containing protein [Calothrix sp. NIES-2098]|uniref:protein phosphatase 2C domain-containing protein n=1 Tax=Calothrix sp. NIES-2098 TaxID=1954171 RepID=UPI000B5E820C|nr:hypothetical protein NIES2098_32590 [Calothrix sp. NIES-2098]
MNPKPSFTVVESLSRSKYGDPKQGDDRLVINQHFVAVLDGATDASGASYDGLSPGRFVAEIGAQAIESLAPDSNATQAIEQLTQAVKEALLKVQSDQIPIFAPCFAIALFSNTRREIWRVGDCQYLLDGKGHNPNSKVDEVTTKLRSLIVHSYLAQGKTITDLIQNDPSQNFLVSIYKLQAALCNSSAEPFGYGVINGDRVPEKYIEVIKIPEQVKSVVLASDGYPDLRITLAESEEILSELIAKDPLFYDLYLGQRGLAPGRESFDDRTYVRLELHD